MNVLFKEESKENLCVLELIANWLSVWHTV